MYTLTLPAWPSSYSPASLISLLEIGFDQKVYHDRSVTFIDLIRDDEDNLGDIFRKFAYVLHLNAAKILVPGEEEKSTFRESISPMYDIAMCRGRSSADRQYFWKIAITNCISHTPLSRPMRPTTVGSLLDFDGDLPKQISAEGMFFYTAQAILHPDPFYAACATLVANHIYIPILFLPEFPLDATRKSILNLHRRLFRIICDRNSKLQTSEDLVSLSLVSLPSEKEDPDA